MGVVVNGSSERESKSERGRLDGRRLGDISKQIDVRLQLFVRKGSVVQRSVAYGRSERSDKEATEKER